MKPAFILDRVFAPDRLQALRANACIRVYADARRKTGSGAVPASRRSTFNTNPGRAARRRA
jgi:hypothetical protein